MWKYQTGDFINASPVIDTDGNLVFGSGDGNLYVVMPGGGLKWSYDLSDKVVATAAIDSNGVIYVGSWDNHLYAIGPEGAFHFKVATGDNTYGSATIGGDGTLYFGSYDGRLYAVTTGSTGPALSHWAQFHHDSKNTGMYTEDGSLPW